MVGLNDFGEAAWAMEQLLNAWLAEQKPMQPPLQLSSDALQTHLIAGPVILPQAKPADGNPRHSVNLPMLCACRAHWFRWWCLVVSKLQKQKLQSPPRKRMWIQPLRLRSNWPEAIDISEGRWCCTRTSNPRKFPRGLNLVLWRTPRPLSPWAAPLQKRSILRSSPRLSRVRAIGGPCRNPACAGRGCGTGSGQPVDLSLPDISFPGCRRACCCGGGRDTTA